jgi:signal transduction histidine kinase
MVYCGLFIAAGRRREFPPRLRQALLINAAAFGLTGGSYLYAVAISAAGLPPVSDANDQLITVLTYAIALVGLLRWPMTSLSRARWLHFGLDAAIGIGGMVLFFFVLITLPGTDGSVSQLEQGWVVTYGSALLLDLVALNVLIVRGLAVPSRRAFWLFMLALVAEIASLIASQYLEYAHPEAATGGGADAIYLVVHLLYIWSGVLFLSDAPREAFPSPMPSWLRSFNPLPLLAIAGVAALLVHESVTGDLRTIAMVAPGLVGLVLLLVIRLMATVRENLQLLRDEAAEERRRQADKMSAVSRLAGGIAHEFNNLMTTVIGHAELGAQVVPVGSAAREDFARIGEAGERAAKLTSQLLAFSGQQLTRPVPMDLAALAIRRGESLAAHPTPGVSVKIAITSGPAMVLGDASQLSLAFDHLLSNALAAMPTGGQLLFGLNLERLEAPLETPYLSVLPGEYLVLVVEDSGVGIPAPDLPRIFDPFFSTRPMHEAAGLGLAAVYGVVAAHDGGIVVESEPSVGTRVRVYLPAMGGK